MFEWKHIGNGRPARPPACPHPLIEAQKLGFGVMKFGNNNTVGSLYDTFNNCRNNWIIFLIICCFLSGAWKMNYWIIFLIIFLSGAWKMMPKVKPMKKKVVQNLKSLSHFYPPKFSFCKSRKGQKKWFFFFFQKFGHNFRLTTWKGA